MVTSLLFVVTSAVYGRDPSYGGSATSRTAPSNASKGKSMVEHLCDWIPVIVLGCLAYHCLSSPDTVDSGTDARKVQLERSNASLHAKLESSNANVANLEAEKQHLHKTFNAQYDYTHDQLTDANTAHYEYLKNMSRAGAVFSKNPLCQIDENGLISRDCPIILEDWDGDYPGYWVRSEIEKQES